MSVLLNSYWAAPAPGGGGLMPTFTGAVSASTTITLPTHATGDHIFIFAFQDGTTTAPTIPAGWIGLGNPVGGASCAGALGYKVAASGSETSGTWTGASGLIAVVVDSSVDMTVGNVSLIQTGTGTSISAPAISPLADAYSGASAILSFSGHRSTDPTMTTPPTGMTNITGGAGSACVLGANRSTANVSSWAGASAAVGGSSSGYATVSVELVFPDMSPATIDELTGSGNWIVPGGVTILKHVMLVGGGGGGGFRAGGGGGAGEIRHIFNLPVTPGDSLAYAIGAGGAGATTSDNPGTAGADTTFNGVSAEGGGRGGCIATSADATKAPSTGGSGGGGGGGNTSTVNLGGVAGTGLGRQNKGGDGRYSSSGQNRGGGGGGAGSVGRNADISIGGNGGDGLDIGAEFPYLATYGDGSGVFAGGGGGGVNGTIITLGAAGSGGAGAGSGNTAAGDATDSTGSGGGGGGATGGSGGDGGDGTIIIAY